MTALVAAAHVVSAHSPHQFERSMQVAATFKALDSGLTTTSVVPALSVMEPAEPAEAEEASRRSVDFIDRREERESRLYANIQKVSDVFSMLGLTIRTIVATIGRKLPG